MNTIITEYLDELDVPYKIKHHAKPVFTSEEAAKERGVRVSQIIKTMLLMDRDEVVVAVLPAHKKLDVKKLKKLSGHKNLQFMDRESIEKKTGLVVGAIAPVGKILLATVKGDVHDIGKNIVAAMLEGAGFDVMDLGYDVEPERFVSAIVDDGAQVIGMSALVTTNMLSMKETMDAIVEAGVRERTKIIIGGAPVTQEYADRIGVDAYAEDAAIAVDIVRGFFKEEN